MWERVEVKSERFQSKVKRGRFWEEAENRERSQEAAADKKVNCRLDDRNVSAVARWKFFLVASSPHTCTCRVLLSCLANWLIVSEWALREAPAQEKQVGPWNNAQLNMDIVHWLFWTFLSYLGRWVLKELLIISLPAASAPLPYRCATMG